MAKDLLIRWRRIFLILTCGAIIFCALLASAPRQLPEHVQKRVRQYVWPDLPFASQQLPMGLKDKWIYKLDDLKKSNSRREVLPVDQIIQVELDTDDFWTASLTSLDKAASLLIPVYPEVDHPRTALLYMPADLSGTYNLIFRAPRSIPKTDDASSEWEPSQCMLYWLVDDKERMYEGRPSLTWQRMREFCGAPRNVTKGLSFALQAGAALPPAPALPYNETIFFRTQIEFSPRASSHWLDNLHTSEDQLQILAERVYGPSSQNILPNSLGYFQRDVQQNGEIGSPNYQPQRDRCPESFKDTLDRPECKSNLAPYRWTSLNLSLQETMIPAEKLQTCLRGKRVRVYGDSLGYGLWRGITCLTAGYGGLEQGKDWQFDNMHLVNMDIAPFFAPREAGIDIDLDEAAKLLNIDDTLGTPDIEIWLIGMWAISYQPSTEWLRGHDRMLHAIKAHADRRNVETYIAQATSPNSDPESPHSILWQSADRAYLWNKILRASAHRIGLNLVDTFWPTVHRFDVRTDNCHFCDSLYYDLAAIVAKSVCSSST